MAVYDLPEPPDTMKRRVVKEESVKRVVAFNLESVGRKMVWMNRVLWPSGAFNPRPLKAFSVRERILENAAKRNDEAAAQAVAGILEWHPGFDEVD